MLESLESLESKRSSPSLGLTIVNSECLDNLDSEVWALFQVFPWQVSSGGRSHDEMDAPHPAKWKMQSRACRAELGLSDSFHPWTGRDAFAGEGLRLTPRVRDVLDLTAAKVFSRNLPSQRGLTDIYVDVSQSLDRNCFTHADGSNPCFTGATELYSFAQDRIILPEEMLAFHGFGHVEMPPSLGCRDLKRMAGTGMSLPCIGSILLSYHIMQTRVCSDRQM